MLSASHVKEIVNRHIRQTADALWCNRIIGEITVFELKVHGVRIEEKTVVSFGDGGFVGPLKSKTSDEKDLIALSHLYAPANLRARLDDSEACVIVIARVITDTKFVAHTVLELDGNYLHEQES